MIRINNVQGAEPTDLLPPEEATDRIYIVRIQKTGEAWCQWVDVDMSKEDHQMIRRVILELARSIYFTMGQEWPPEEEE